MTGANRDILKFIRQARDRIHMSLMLEFTLKALSVSLGLYLALALASRFVPVYDAYGKGALLTGVLTLSGFLISLFITPKDKEAAMLLDSKGLSERTMTALELIHENSTIAMLQRQDALEHLRALNINKEIKLKLPKRLALICCILAVLTAVSGFIPNPMEERAIELHEIKEQIKKQQKEVDEAIKRIENNNKLTLEQKKEAEAALKELKKELGEAKDLKEAEKTLQRTENKISMLRDKYTDKQLNDIIKAFSQNEATKSLAETLEKGGAEKLKSDLQKAAEALNSLDAEQLKELSKNLSELARELSENPELAEAFYNLAQKMAAGELGDMQSEISELGEQISKLMENDEFSRAMEDVMQQLKNAGAQSQNQQGQGQQSGGQQSQGQGQGQAGGNPAGGAGSGTGSDSEAQSPQGSGNGLGRKDPSPSDVREYEKVFTPSLAGGEGDKSQLHGNKGDEGETKLYETNNGLGIRGEMKPYDQVIGEYREKAFQSIEGSQIPQSMQDIVKDYFTSLED